jgi:membrane protein implicated in regulation of membrane protease activity
VVDYAILAVYFAVVIGGLLTLYGIVLTVMGLFASGDTKAKAAGININLWAGLVILAGGAVFLAWARRRPLRAEDLQGATPTAREGRAECGSGSGCPPPSPVPT